MNSSQRVIKYLAMALAACLTIGILAIILNVAVGVFGAFIPESKSIGNKHDKETVVEEIDSETVYEDVENLKIESSVYKIDIVKDSSISGVKIACSNIPSSYKIYYKKGSKTISTTDDNWVSGIFNNKSSSSKGLITIYISDKIELDKVDIEMGVGSVTVSDITMENLEVNCGVGMFSCENVVARSADVSGGVGNVECKDVTFDGLELEGGVGDVTISGILTGKTQVSAGMGNVKLDINGSKEDYNVKVETGLGSIYIDGEKYSDFDSYNNSESNLIDIEGGIGSIHVDFN